MTTTSAPPPTPDTRPWYEKLHEAPASRQAAKVLKKTDNFLKDERTIWSLLFKKDGQTNKSKRPTKTPQRLADLTPNELEALVTRAVKSGAGHAIASDRSKRSEERTRYVIIGIAGVFIIVAQLSAVNWSKVIGDAIREVLPDFVERPLMGEPEPVVNSSSRIDVSTEVQAFLDLIAWAEAGEYDIIVGGGRFTDFSKHPDQMVHDVFDVSSTAAGRYQFITTTWQGIADRLGLKDFSPESQDRAAVQLLKDIGAYDQIKQGDIAAAICTAGSKWASFPCNDYGQNPKSLDTLLAKYDELLTVAKTAAPAATLVASTSAIAAPTNGIDATIAKTGDPIGNRFVVTSGWGPRSSPGGVGSSYHMGLDIALASGDSTGVPLYAIGLPGAKVTVTCWEEPLAGLNIAMSSDGIDYGFDYGHLDTSVCEPGETVTVTAGDQVATIGNSGSATTGPHLHMQQRRGGTYDPKTGEHKPVYMGFAKLALGVK